MRISLDARTNIIIAAAFSTLALVYQDPAVLGVLFVFNLAILAVLGVRVRVYKRTILCLAYMYLFLIVLQSLFVRSGEALVSLGDLPVLTTGGVTYGISILLRFLIFMAAGLLLTGSRATDLVCALTHFRIPFEIVFMIQLGIRFVPLLMDEMRKTIQSIQLRGVDLRKVYKRKVIKVYIGLFMPVLYAIWRKSEKITILLELRGFRKHESRTYWRELSFGTADYVTLFLLCVFLGAFVFWATFR